MNGQHSNTKSSPNHSQARLGVLGVAALGVLANSIVMSSCDLLRYDEGSLGLMRYADEETGACTAFVTLEDQSLKTAQSASLGAFALGVVYFALSSAYEFYIRFPLKNAVLTACAMIIEMCLMAVYSAKNNGICEMQGCTWGAATIYLAVAQIAFIAASIGSIYTSQNKDVPFSPRSSFSGSGKNDTISLSQRRLNVSLDLGNST